jgi:ubiquinol oxidase
MEELGGNNRWFDRFLAKHIGIAYYWLCFTLYLIKPSLAYNLSENIEKHAFESYD